MSRLLPYVVSVSKAAQHQFSKTPCASINVIAGQGVEGDAHKGEKVKHRSRVKADPDQPNLRQVHLIHAELLETLSHSGFKVKPGDLGENITTFGVDLLALPRGTILKLGTEAELEVTGLRNPCAQIEAFQTGLLSAVIDHGPKGEIIRKSGIMAIARKGGAVHCGDSIQLVYPPFPHQVLERV